MAKNIIFIGQLTDVSGYGHGARSYFRSLLSLDKQGLINLSVINFSFEQNKYFDEDIKHAYDSRLLKINDFITKKTPEYSVVFFLTNNLIAHMIDTKEHPISSVLANASEIYPCVVWETNKPPQSWIKSYEKIQPKIKKLICACQWNKETFSENTKIESVKIPYLITNKEEIDLEYLEKFKTIRKDFNFITVSQWSHRKGFDKLIKAFLLEFKNDPNVNLIIKTYANKAMDTSIDESQYFVQKINKIKSHILEYGRVIESKAKIVIIRDVLSRAKINSLYKISDCYVTTTRGEGFGFPIAEYAYNAKPIISPDKGGHTDLVAPENIFIKSEYEPVELQHPLYSSDMNYVEPSLNSTRDIMRKIHTLKSNSPEKYDLIGIKTREYIQDYLKESDLTELFKSTLGV